jgi:hypothetical protein
MDPEDFEKTWSELTDVRGELQDRRVILETELNEVIVKLNHLDEVLSHLAPLAGHHYDADNLSGLGITDAIRMILQSSDERMSATEVRKALQERGFDLSGLSAPMASIYKILSRLVNDSNEVERETDEGRVFFIWKRPPPSPISDEDIPF